MLINYINYGGRLSKFVKTQYVIEMKVGSAFFEPVRDAYNVEDAYGNLLYIQLVEVLFKETSDKFTVRVANKPEDIQALLEIGFEYVCEKDGFAVL